MTRRLVGVREISKLLGTSRQRADQLARTKEFPEPVTEVASGRLWARSEVVRWGASMGRSMPWATVELELEQLPRGGPGSAVNIYRMAWEAARMKALAREPKGAPATRQGAHAIALAAAREVDPGVDVQMPADVDYGWHHIVPKFLIRRFSEDPGQRNAVVHWYDVATGEYGTSTPRDSAVIRGYNTLDEEGLDPLAIEKQLARAEDAAAETVVAMKKGADFNTSQQLALARLITLQYSRSPRTRQQQAEIRAALDGVDLQMALPTVQDGRNPRDRQWWEAAGLESLRRGEGSDASNAAAAEIVGQFNVDDVLPLMLVQHMKWAARDGSGLDFVIADHPVHLHDPLAPLGGVGVAWFSSPTVQVTMPIDPTCCLTLSQNPELEGADLPAGGAIMYVNLRQYASAVRLVFGRSRRALEGVVTAARDNPQLVDSFRPRPMRVRFETSQSHVGKYNATIFGDPMYVHMPRPLRNDGEA